MSTMNYPSIATLRHSARNNFFLIAGPCVIESRELCERVAATCCECTEKYDIPYIFKASYRKENRSRLDSFTGIGDVRGLEVLQYIREKYKIPVLTDIHETREAAIAASYGVDVLQIPAFLCRQTHLLQAAAETGKVVNIKKGQFMAPGQMQFAIDKVKHFGNDKVMLTERGTQFGYSDLVVDFRGIPQMKAMGCPVILDVTHSLQQPNQSCGVTGGRPESIKTLATAGIALGVDGLFLETHPNPREAKSDGANMLPMDRLDALLDYLLPFSAVANKK